MSNAQIADHEPAGCHSCSQSHAIPMSIGNTEYRGVGRAWVAVRDNAVAAIRYMNDFAPTKLASCPDWYKAYLENTKPTYRRDEEPVFRWGGRKEMKLITLPFAFYHLHREAYREERRLFGEWRLAAREELAQYGTVMSGDLSRGHFHPSRT